MPTKPWRDIQRNMTSEQIKSSQVKAEALRVGIFINNLRKQKGLTQQQLADLLGVTQQAVSKMEWGEEIQLTTLNKVIVTLGGSLVAHMPEGDYSLCGAE